MKRTEVNKMTDKLITSDEFSDWSYTIRLVLSNQKYIDFFTPIFGNMDTLQFYDKNDSEMASIELIINYNKHVRELDKKKVDRDESKRKR